MTTNNKKILSLLKTASSFAHSSKERINIYGILLHSTQSELRIQATDGHKLIEMRYIYQNDSPFTEDFENGFIPKDKLDILIKLLSINYNVTSIQESIQHNTTDFPNTNTLYNYESLINSNAESNVKNYYMLELLSQVTKGLSNLYKAFSEPKIHFTQFTNTGPLALVCKHKEIKFVALLMYTRE